MTPVAERSWGWEPQGWRAHRALAVRRHLQEPHQTLEAMLRPKVTTLPGHIQAVYVQNVVKLYASILQQKEQAAEPEAAQDVTQLMVDRLPQFVQSADLEVQERVSVSRGAPTSGRARILCLCLPNSSQLCLSPRATWRNPFSRALPQPGVWADLGHPWWGRQGVLAHRGGLGGEGTQDNKQVGAAVRVCHWPLREASCWQRVSRWVRTGVPAMVRAGLTCPV